MNIIPLEKMAGQAIDDMAKPVLTLARLKAVLVYDPDTGVFSWLQRIAKQIRLGSVAGSVSCKGRHVIRIDGRIYYSARLAVFYMTGEMPPDDVDHRDTDKLNNRYLNLRVVSQQVNNQNHVQPYKNNQVGLLGVTRTRNGKYRASLVHKRKSIHLGTFADALPAHEAYLTEKRRLHEGCTL